MFSSALRFIRSWSNPDLLLEQVTDSSNILDQAVKLPNSHPGVFLREKERFVISKLESTMRCIFWEFLDFNSISSYLALRRKCRGDYLESTPSKRKTPPGVIALRFLTRFDVGYNCCCRCRGCKESNGEGLDEMHGG
jgi:hypothetical protein